MRSLSRCAVPGNDAHEFVAEALRNGAVCALVERVVADVPPSRLVCVADTLKALGDLAAWTRSVHPLRVVAITGSNGKTTTKEMIASICTAAVGADGVRKSEGNFNNLIGLPLTLLQLRGDETVAVLEMGMNHPGEIARLTEIARPNYAVITNVGSAHLEGVGGTLAGVAAAKGELFAGLWPDAVIAVNREDDWVRRLAASYPSRAVTFGRDGDVRARNIAEQAGDGVAFDLHIGADSAAGPLATHRTAQRDECACGGGDRSCDGPSARGDCAGAGTHDRSCDAHEDGTPGQRRDGDQRHLQCKPVQRGSRPGGAPAFLRTAGGGVG